jgi:copper(I)-binding protein
VERRVLSSVVLGFGAALALAGCGAGQITQTSTILPAVNGAFGQAGPVSVRDANLANRDQCEQAYPAASNAPLEFTIANSGQRDDELVSINSTNATSAAIEGQKTIVAGSTLVASAAFGAKAPSGVDTKIGHTNVTLNGLKSVVWPGQLVPVTFAFRDSGSVTLDLPIGSPTKTLSCAPAPGAGA